MLSVSMIFTFLLSIFLFNIMLLEPVIGTPLLSRTKVGICMRKWHDMWQEERRHLSSCSVSAGSDHKGEEH
uniref:Putative secreted protein n=1 Tax=Anopheles darlingi TaxID=43151 RepID=A0A2M4DL74_ANODA